MTRKDSAQVTRVCKVYAVDNIEEFVTRDSGLGTQKSVPKYIMLFVGTKKTVCYIHVCVSVLSGFP